MSRPLPAWFDEAKVGVFLHWGIFSVPSYGPATLAEWYWWGLSGAKSEPTVSWHKKTYGEDFSYAEFAPMFKAEFFDPDEWAAMFKDAGIKYVVLTSKHHEGFTNWCSKESFNWNSCDTGPKRDLVADLTKSVRAAGLHMGLYHSIFEWFHPLYLQDKANNFTTRRYVDEVYYPQAVELNKLYQPDLIWSDGDWEANSSYWRSPELLAWLYNDGAGTADKVVVNDRWGNENPAIGSGHHFGGYFSGADRQQANPELLKHKWESAFTLDGATWGYARNNNLDTYLPLTTVLQQIVSTVAYGGNALMNIGPTHDGRIATIFQERMKQLGSWLKINGEAIYGSKMWHVQNDTATHGVEEGVYYTASANPSHSSTVYAHMMGWPEDNHLILTQAVGQATATTLHMLGCSAPITWVPLQSGGMDITIPPLNPKQLPSLEGPWVFELKNVTWVGPAGKGLYDERIIIS